MKVSVIIPAFNEEKVISSCIKSLQQQSFKDLEIIIIDDGSTDKTKEIVQSLDVKLLQQDHKGAGEARNLGVKKARGEILVFVDADMEFEKKFTDDLTLPIREGKVIGTFSKNEFVLNKENIWSKCWNINKGLPWDRMHNKDYPDHQPVFRAIFKKEFERAGGFKPIGYIDDYTISEKLGVEAVAVEGAKFYHRNPDNLKEIYHQARWIGKSEYKKRKVKNETFMRLAAIARYSLPFTLFNGLYSAIRFALPQFMVFKIVYDFATEISLFKSFFGEQKYK